MLGQMASLCHSVFYRRCELVCVTSPPIMAGYVRNLVSHARPTAELQPVGILNSQVVFSFPCVAMDLPFCQFLAE